MQQEIKVPITRSKLAELYQTTSETLALWLIDLGIEPYKRLTAKELNLLFEVYGSPCLLITCKPMEQYCHTNAVLPSNPLKDKTTLYYPVRRKKLAEIFQVDSRTICRWVGEAGILHSKTLSPNEVKIFLAKYGLPNGYRLDF